MVIRLLEIENFRGIAHLRWHIPNGKKVVCIVGPGDSGKTSILDALDWLLGDRWNIPISVDDFLDDSKPIRIAAALCNIPAELTTCNVHGLHLCGMTDNGTLIDEPINGSELCLYVELRIGADLEPSWSVIRPKGSLFEPLRIGERRKLGVSKLDDRVDIHLRWSHASALSKVSRHTDGVKTAMGEAMQAARQALKDISLPADFNEVLKSVKAESNKFGAVQRGELSPGLDSSRGGYGSVALYSGDIPVYKYGLGTRRLTGLAIQKLGAAGKSTLLIDEIEGGLEPHRVVGLIETLRCDETVDQVFLTTHSSNVVESCSASEICVLSNTHGDAVCTFVPPELERLHRSNPSPFLARSIVVVEGKTEEGLYRAFAEKYNEDARRDRRPTLAALGVCLCQGDGGAQAVSKAMAFASLGYRVSLLIDSDVERVNNHAGVARGQGIMVCQWPEGWCAENAIFDCLDDNHIPKLINYMIVEDLVPEERIASDFTNAGYPDIEGFLCETKRQTLDDSEIRNELASIASKHGKKSKGWFKSVSSGLSIGRWLIRTADENSRFEMSHLNQLFSHLLTGSLLEGDYE